jgi:hypothetical protein
VGSTCCYTSARFSPDGSHLLFAYQDINTTAPAKLYYVSYGSLGTGAAYQPLDLPENFFSNPRANLDAALRPAKP